MTAPCIGPWPLRNVTQHSLGCCHNNNVRYTLGTDSLAVSRAQMCKDLYCIHMHTLYLVLSEAR